MSHHSSEPKICPNCGYPAVENYCAQCGQETHLHKDTFWALIKHFAGHYLHYDSKFWKTLRALWFSPGLLTTAYWEEKRMRYIPPISLYIFISFVYFFTGSLIAHREEERLQEGKNAMIANNVAAKSDSIVHKDSLVAKALAQSEAPGNITFHFNSDSGISISGLPADTANTARDTLGKYTKNRFFNFAKVKRKLSGMNVKEELEHLFPKLFFFLIPCMALVLKLLFLRRRELFYVNHVIFSLHYHALWFSVLWLVAIYPFARFSFFINIAASICVVVYMVKALKNVYQIKTARALLYTTIIGCSYVILGIIVTILGFLVWLLSMAV